MDYPFGAVKQEPVTKAVAVRRNTPPDDVMAWGFFHPVHGGGYARTAEVADWPDIGGAG